MIPVCVPTYKHPKYDYIDRVMKSKEFENKKYSHPLYYFIYDIDWDSFNYDYYKDKFNELHFIKVPFDQYKTAMRMRKFIQEYMKDFDAFFLFDNDTQLGARGFNYESNLMENIETNDFLDIWENLPESKDYAISRPCTFYLGIKHSKKPASEYKFCKAPAQIILFNNKLMKENNIFYSGDTECSEDIEIAVNCLCAGLKIGELQNYFMTTIQPIGNSGAAWYNLESLLQKTYEKLKHTGFLHLGTDKKGNPKMTLLPVKSKENDFEELW